MGPGSSAVLLPFLASLSLWPMSFGRLEVYHSIFWPVQKSGINSRVFSGVPHNCLVLFRLHPPWFGGIDGLPVDLQPLANSKEPFLEDGDDHAVFIRSDVEKIVASQTYCLNQFLNDFIFVDDGRHAHVSPIAPGRLVHAGAHLPLVVWQAVWSVFVFTVVVPSVTTGAVLTPPVIHYHLILDRAFIVEPSKELRGFQYESGHSHSPSDQIRSGLYLFTRSYSSGIVFVLTKC